MCIGFSSLLYSALCTFSSLFLLPYLFSTYFFILFLRLCFFVTLRSWTLFAAVLFSYSCHAYALVADTIFFITLLFVVCHSSPAFLSSSITSSPRVRTTFSSLLLPFYLFSLYIVFFCFDWKESHRNFLHAIPIFVFLSWSCFTG
jgi:hypothetical protein